jgi:dihydroxyacetone kinase-like protein
MNTQQLSELIQGAMKELEGAEDELRRLDAAIGDGDLGITVSAGARAVSAELGSAAGFSTAADVLKAAAKKFATANPSTMAALVSTGLLAASRVIGDVTDLDRRTTVRLAEAAALAIQNRGGAERGDKTMLDALLPAVEALGTAPDDAPAALAAMITAASEGVEATRGMQSRRGRAAWVGERSAGQPDGGATAVVRLLQALDAAWPQAGAR